MDETDAQPEASSSANLQIVERLRAKLSTNPAFTIEGLRRDAPAFLDDADADGFDRLEPIKQWAILITEVIRDPKEPQRWMSVHLVAQDAWREIEASRGLEGDVLAEEAARAELPPVDEYDDDTLGMTDKEKTEWAFDDLDDAGD